MDAHQLIEQFTYWAVLAIGGALLMVLTWAAKGIIKRLDKLEELLSEETRALRDLYHSLDKRLTTMEVHCDILHNGHVDQRRRASDRDDDDDGKGYE